MAKQSKPASEYRMTFWRRLRRYRIAYLFIAPAVAVMLLVHIIPAAQAIYLSLTDLNNSTYLLYLRAPFIGLEHYLRIFRGLFFGGQDALITNLGQSVVNSFWFAFWLILGTLFFGLILALLLNREFRGRGIARTLVLLPWVVPSFVVGIVWQFIWAQRGGLANRILVDWLHVVDKPISWLLLKNARTALIIPAVWRGLPFTTVLLLSALQTVPVELYEAAAIDGANAWQRFRRITLPYLMPMILISTMFNIIFNFFGFGPYNIAVSLFSSDKLGRYVDLLSISIVHQTFSNQLYGFGAAASTLIMIATLIFVGIWYSAFSKKLTSE